MSNRSFGLDDTVYDYLLAHSLHEPDVMKRLREETARLPEHNMQIAPEQGQFLGLLVELTGAERIVEVGTFTGYSALAMATAMPETGRMIACDIDPDFTAIAQRFWKEAGVDHKIDLRLGPAIETLAELVEELGHDSVDMAFIDADKPNYHTYYERCLDLLRPGGLAVIDNVLWSGRVADPKDVSANTAALKAFNERLAKDDRVTISMLPLADGVTLARKR
jgi:predicted O-methyltransferase YrrM